MSHAAMTDAAMPDAAMPDAAPTGAEMSSETAPAWCTVPAGMRVAASVLLVAALALPPLRNGLEGSMSAHMLVQMPLLALAGFVAAGALPANWRAALHRHAGGSLPLALAAMLASSYWMLPRALDAALVDAWAETAKFLSLPLLVGAPLALAWERLGTIGRGFVWTNFFSMLAVLGWLYIAAPVRVCNNYLVDEQASAGWSMVYLAVALFAGWLCALFVGGRPAPADTRQPRPQRNDARELAALAETEIEWITSYRRS